MNDLTVTVIRKKIKHLHLKILPPEGIVRITAPYHVTDQAIHLAVIERRAWIKKHIEAFKNRPVVPSITMKTGEIHQVFGEDYTLKVIEQSGKQQLIADHGNKTLMLYIRDKTPLLNKIRLLNEWYRAELKSQIPLLINQWQPIIGVCAHEWNVKQMKTRWGTCNIKAARIWINLELAKKPPECLEYVVVHELTHLLERYHNARFWGYMDRFLPNWKSIRAYLNKCD